MSKTLITGATGFLGTHLLNYLLKTNKKNLRILISSEMPESIPNTVEVVKGSITDSETVKQAVDGISKIYHLAGKVSRNADDRRQMYAIHIDGTRLLCEAAKKEGVKRIVMASTSGTIAITKTGEEIPDETWPTPIEFCSRWPYYASKVYQEETARHVCADKVELIMLNPSLLLGPGDARLSSTNDILKFLSRDIPLIPPGGLNFVDVRDVAVAFANAMQRGRKGERYLLGGPNWTFEKFFGRLERLTKVSAPKLRTPAKVAFWGAKIADSMYRHWGKVPPVEVNSVEMAEYFWYLDSTKAERELGFLARDPGETLYDTVTYLKENFLPTESFK
ncbi:MAG: NAD-dependent epimerase/dehydratase family protein [Acidobacteria bacterium]|nr:NAD-dependent epimerase/dehydratase family protein [Acidobacteriota bacterium]